MDRRPPFARLLGRAQWARHRSTFHGIMTQSGIGTACMLCILALAACRAENAAPFDDGASPPAGIGEPPPSSSPASATPADSGGLATEAEDTVDLIDPTIPPAIAGEDGWNYSLVAEADLTSDGVPERVVLTARVEMIRGRPAWDDGQPWQVYVETADGERTYLYARRLQLGTLEMRVTSASTGAPPDVVLIEHLPDRFSVFEAAYRAPGAVSTSAPFVRTLDPRGEVASPSLP